MFGDIETNLGIGVVFEKVIDYDSHLPSDKILDYIDKNKIDAIKYKKFILDQLNLMFNAFADNLLFTTSFGLENILVQKLSQQEIKIITMDFKIQIHKEWIPITKIKNKIKRRGKRLIKIVQNTIENIESNEDINTF